ncbi:hypothetical protein [Amycolatopsis sp. NPDC051372]|uniref:hypothetical protein n=1 Tax=Amycolatopsis sp. NPDC051372 TaxID=3155669 RepID=UPI0034234152
MSNQDRTEYGRRHRPGGPQPIKLGPVLPARRGSTRRSTAMRTRTRLARIAAATTALAAAAVFVAVPSSAAPQQADHHAPANPKPTIMFHDVTDHPFGGTPIARVVSETDERGNALPGAATLITDGHDGALTATPGYDDVTGLGSPALGYLATFSK